MKKLLNLKRLLKARSKGFTLVEVILSCALLSILILGIMMFVTPVLKMVTSGQKNARATMLSETVDTYIAGVLRTAAVVEVFENVNLTSTTGGSVNLGALSSNAQQGINKISDFMSKSSEDGIPNSSQYEVRSLALVCKDDGAITSQGVRLYNATVDSGTLNLDATSLKTENQALNDLMFEGLYATIKLENFNTINSSTGAETTDLAKGYKISTVVYNESKCYNIAQDTRDKSIQAFTGVTYFQNLNLESASQTIKIQELQDAMDAHGAPGDGKLYYPATIIYYVAPKK